MGSIDFAGVRALIELDHGQFLQCGERFSGCQLGALFAIHASPPVHHHLKQFMEGCLWDGQCLNLLCGCAGVLVARIVRINECQKPGGVTSRHTPPPLRGCRADCGHCHQGARTGTVRLPSSDSKAGPQSRPPVLAESLGGPFHGWTVGSRSLPVLVRFVCARAKVVASRPCKAQHPVKQKRLPKRGQ